MSSDVGSLGAAISFERVAAELLRALRGGRSQAAFSRRLGYRSNIVNRWEAQKAFPSAARFLQVMKKLRPKEPSCLHRFFVRLPAALAAVDPLSPAAVGVFLGELRGKTPLLSVAQASGFNRYSISRWFGGRAQPSLPQFLALIEVTSRRLLDFLACCTEPARLNSAASAWKQLVLAREVAYEVPWSHAVLRALELAGSASKHQKSWLADRLGISASEVSKALGVLERTGQAHKVRGRWHVRRVMSVNTSADRERSLALKVMWTETALSRMRSRAPGNFGYSVFAVSKADMRRMLEVHLDYVRAMQSIVAASAPGECVGLYCAQLLDLAASNNALAE